MNGDSSWIPTLFGRIWNALAFRLRRESGLVRALASVYSPVALRQRAPSLPAPLIVSLTSYPPRFRTLALTLRGLLRQTIKADRTILWIAEGDFDRLPRNVLALQSRGLEIRRTEDTRSYKKILPALDAFPEAFLCTADDDVYYWPAWLKELTAGAGADHRLVRCHRANEFSLDPVGCIQPYNGWTMNVARRGESNRILPTGVGGVLYPPGILRHRGEDRAAAFALCPSADDVWLFFMGRRNGARYATVGSGRPILPWHGSQEQSLWQFNSNGQNDIQIARMIERYGFPNEFPNGYTGQHQQDATSKPEPRMAVEDHRQKNSRRRPVADLAAQDAARF